MWLATVIWSLALFAAAEDSLFRRRVVLSALLMWIGGVTLYVVFPALGPSFAFEETWQDIQGSLPRAEETQQTLRDNYQSVCISCRLGFFRRRLAAILSTRAFSGRRPFIRRGRRG